RPKPSESFSASISAIFKVLLSLFFSAQFFIDYFTLPFTNFTRNMADRTHSDTEEKAPRFVMPF
ncbi:hypothetical protein B5F37_10045, partial [Drancourtella sp. An210]